MIVTDDEMRSDWHCFAWSCEQIALRYSNAFADRAGRLMQSGGDPARIAYCAEQADILAKAYAGWAHLRGLS